MSVNRGDGRASAIRLAVLLCTAGVLHFVKPDPFDAIVPRRLPGSARLWTQLSGVAELLLGTGLVFGRTRRVSAFGAAALFVAVIPANVVMAIQWWRRPLRYRMVALGRLPLQIPLVTEALKTARSAASA